MAAPRAAAPLAAPLLLLLLLPQLPAAAALLRQSDVDPAMEELLGGALDAEGQWEEKRSGLRAAMVARGSGGSRGDGVRIRTGWQVGGAGEDALVERRSQPPNAPYLSVGVLSNVEQYFKGLREQLESLADQPMQNSVSQGAYREGPRPSATAAYLHALRSHRPSHRVRSFVEDPGPLELRGANSHDPALLWAGLGRRRRR